MSNLLFKYGSYMNLYVADNKYMYRFWYTGPTPVVLESATTPDGSIVRNCNYTDRGALDAKLLKLTRDPDFQYGEYMNWAVNHSYQRFDSLSEINSI